MDENVICMYTHGIVLFVYSDLPCRIKRISPMLGRSSATHPVDAVQRLCGAASRTITPTSSSSLLVSYNLLVSIRIGVLFFTGQSFTLSSLPSSLPMIISYAQTVSTKSRLKHSYRCEIACFSVPNSALGDKDFLQAVSAGEPLSKRSSYSMHY